MKNKTKEKTSLATKSLAQLQFELLNLKLDLKVNKLKDTSQIKKLKKQIARLKTKL